MQDISAKCQTTWNKEEASSNFKMAPPTWAISERTPPTVSEFCSTPTAKNTKANSNLVPETVQEHTITTTSAPTQANSNATSAKARVSSPTTTNKNIKGNGSKTKNMEEENTLMKMAAIILDSFKMG